MKAIKKAKKGRGRPPKRSTALDAAIADVEAGDSPEIAASKHGVAARTVRRRSDAQRGLGGSSGKAVRVSPVRAPVVDSAGAEEPARTVALVRRILAARDPAALAELDAGLVEAAKGEAELVAFLSRPAMAGAPIDPLDALTRALDAATANVERLPPLHPRAATVLGAVATLSAKLESVAKGRPREPTPDAVQEALRAASSSCVEHLLRHTRAASATLAKSRASLFDGLDLRPTDRAELGRRLATMLDAS